MDDPEETFGGDGDASPAPYEELVSVMAGGLYGELERLVGAHGPTAVSGLLPQVVSVLEALQEACGQVKDRDQALERLRDDRLRLLEQYERERAGRKRADERFMELEDMMDQERKAHSTAVSQLEAQSRILDSKARSYADQVAGLEEQKSSLLKEISILNQSHTKMVQSYKELRSQKVALAGPGQTSTSSTEDKRPKPSPVLVPPQFLSRPSDLKPLESSMEHGEMNELSHSEKTPQKVAERNVFPLAQEMDIQPEKDASPSQPGFDLDELLSSTPELKSDPQMQNRLSLLPHAWDRKRVSGLSPDLLIDMDDGADLQGDALETLIAENTQLQEARIALDTARRHLINRVEELSEERESLRMENERSLIDLRSCQMQLKEAELEIIRIRQEFKESRRSSEEGEAEGGLPRTQRFTRAEMARVVMERNLYKERLMELQEAVRRAELLRASQEEQAIQMKKSSFWKIFDRLFNPSDAPESAVGSPLPAGRSRPSRNNQRDSGRKTLRFMSPSEADGSPQQKRRELYSEIRSHIWQEHGRAQIHGWSQPPSFQGPDSSAGITDVPVLVQLRMLEQKDPSTKLWCAAASVGPEPRETSQIGNPHCSSSGSSQLWVAAGTHSASEVTLFNAPNTNQLLEHFVLPGIHILSMACVPGLTAPVDETPVIKPEILEDPLAPRTDSDEEAREMEAVGTGPTVWIGTQEGCIYIHSTETDWRHCQGKIRLKEAVHCIVHTQGRVVAALADGSLAIFHRNADRNWELHAPRLVQLGRPRRSIRCMIPVFNWLWCGYGNRIYVLDPRTARIQRYFEVTSHPESHVRHMAAAGGGIWISVRLETTLRLLHAETGQPLQEVELEPFISRTFGPSSVSLALNISALGAFGKRLWVGTSGGTIISVPFVSEFSESVKTSPSAGIPLCAMEQAQISYHGHRDAVRFFVSVPGYVDPSAAENLRDSHSQEKPSKLCSLVLSGGEGYINLRIGDNSDKHYGDLLHPNPRLRRAERSHLIVWQVQG
ncbi:C-Jun-amino-terminal kinase-interacting protein 4-like isoform X2 [Ahaetulla prasina]|uniref:C-Jun-amino-terminal kinase-interacting protein 4-like isoform X2 n=1 Tax=Ahaetulla prasina TaxID=499056 RepID=UPI002647851B|nr:C-Jun-amino-terminal kinase-interacting protein 4-like isoform X2 [Ahaetulla prasina]